MSNLPAVPTALELLDTQLSGGADAEGLLLPLKALQFRGFSKLDLTVHVERVRARNEARENDEGVDEACVLALEIIEGLLPAHRLHWDSAHAAASLIPRVLSVGDLRDALPAALEPSDLLPPRRSERLLEALADLAPRTLERLDGFAVLPTRAAFYPAPKSAFTTRPAALLRTPDRLALEALVGPACDAIDAALPQSVLWPRHRHQRPTTGPQEIALGWQSRYIVKADVADFFANVEHATLATFLARFVKMPVLAARALDALLGAVMGSNRGLPQGPPVSDVLASAYLLPIDTQLTSESIEYIRFADDFYFPAASVGESRRILRRLEALLRDVGLTLNTAKTRVMKRETFIAGQRKPLQEVENLRGLAENPPDDSDVILAALEDAGVDEQTLWELAYHHTVSLEEVVEGVVDEKLEVVAEFYASGLSVVAQALAAGNPPPDMSSVESLAREGFAFLSSATDVSVDVETVAVLHRWFPGLAPRLVELLEARAVQEPEWTDAAILASLTNPWDDWATAWMCYAAGSSETVSRNEHVRTLLEAIARAPDSGELARSEAVRALIGTEDFEPDLWVDVFRAASIPLRAEMLLVGLTEAPNAGWLRTRRELVQETAAALGTALTE